MSRRPQSSRGLLLRFEVQNVGLASTKYRAYLCCGRNCGPKGSGELLDFLADEVTRLGIEHQVTVLPTGCQSHCESGPTMVVYPGPVYYQAMDEGRLREIAKAHLRDGMPVQEYFWTGTPLRIGPNKIGAHDSWVGKERLLNTNNPRGQTIPPRRKEKPEDVDDFKW
ncbi:MAG: (2Fe-2S) ferredoxin domain-containing protein [Chloroflexia bacterium]